MQYNTLIKAILRVWCNKMHLINYLTVKDGLRFNSESFINVVPASLLQNQLNVVTDVLAIICALLEC